MYCVEAGLALVIVPWSVYWERNLFAESVPYLATITQNPFVRGAVSGVGLLNLWVGLAELIDVLLEQRAKRRLRALAPRTDRPIRPGGGVLGPDAGRASMVPGGPADLFGVSSVSGDRLSAPFAKEPER